MKELVTAGLLVFGGAFILIGAIGIVRMPDVFSRMQATTKAMALGSSCLLFAVVIHFAQVGVGIRVLLVIAFFFLTAPVAAHMIGRAAYLTRTPLWKGTVLDELKDRYDVAARKLESRSADEPPA